MKAVFGGATLIAALAMASGSAVALPLTGTNPNVCLPGSTATSCLVALDIREPDPVQYGMFVPGSISIANGGSTLRVQFDAGTVGGLTYSFSDLHLNLSTAYFPEFSSLTNINYTMWDGVVNSGQSFDINLSGPSIYQADGWGDFNFFMDNENGSDKAMTSLSFDVNFSSPIWNNLLTQQVLQLNGHANAHSTINPGGQSAAAHYYILTGTAGNYAKTAFTGFAAWPNCFDLGSCLSNPVPEPSPAALLGLGSAIMILGTAVGRRRRIRA